MIVSASTKRRLGNRPTIAVPARPREGPGNERPDQPVATFQGSVPFGYTPVWAEGDKYQVKGGKPSGRPVRLGIVGLGGVALGKHLPALRRLCHEQGLAVEIVAGAEIDAMLRAACEQRRRFPCYGAAAEMFAHEVVDGVLLLTDPGESRRQAFELAIERGVHVLAEKQILFEGVDRLDEAIARARALVEAAQRRGLIVMTGFVKRFSPPYAQAKELVEAGAIGAPALVAVKMCQGWSRPILLEGQACHLLHVALWIAGPIEGLQALAVNRFHEPAYPFDNVVVNVTYRSGAIGTFYFNSSSPSLKPWERLEIFGERRWLAVEDGVSLTLHDTEEGPSKVWAPVMPHTLFFDEEFSGFTHELRAFVEAVRDGTPPPVTGEDGIEALIVARMIHRAIAERRYVGRDEMEGRAP